MLSSSLFLSFFSFTEYGNLAQPLTSYRLILIRLPFYGLMVRKRMSSLLLDDIVRCSCRYRA